MSSKTGSVTICSLSISTSLQTYDLIISARLTMHQSNRHTHCNQVMTSSLSCKPTLYESVLTALPSNSFSSLSQYFCFLKRLTVPKVTWQSLDQLSPLPTVFIPQPRKMCRLAIHIISIQLIRLEIKGRDGLKIRSCPPV